MHWRTLATSAVALGISFAVGTAKADEDALSKLQKFQVTGVTAMEEVDRFLEGGGK